MLLTWLKHEETVPQSRDLKFSLYRTERCMLPRNSGDVGIVNVLQECLVSNAFFEEDATRYGILPITSASVSTRKNASNIPA